MRIEPPEVGSDSELSAVADEDSGVSSTETDEAADRKPRRRVQRGQQSFWLKKSPVWLRRIEARETRDTSSPVNVIRRRYAVKGLITSARLNFDQVFVCAVNLYESRALWAVRANGVLLGLRLCHHIMMDSPLGLTQHRPITDR